jgi:hypothetical protein
MIIINSSPVKEQQGVSLGMSAKVIIVVSNIPEAAEVCV